MDEDAALAATNADDSTELAPEVRAELLSLAQGARETISRARSPHTHRAYAGTWSRFGEWARARGLQTLPAEPATLLLHLQDLAGKGKAASTIRTAASAVSAAHRAAGFRGGENPSAHEDVKTFLRGIEREAAPQRQAAAMLPNVISAIRATARIPRRGRGGSMETQKTAEARARVDVALVLALRDGGLRISEAAVLAWKDVDRWPDGSGRLTIRRSKSDQEGRGAVVAVTRACLQALDAIRTEDSAPEDRVFRLSVRQMGNRLKNAADAAGLEGDAFSSHSGRVGMGPHDERRRSSHRDHHAAGTLEVGRDGPAVHQGGVGGALPCRWMDGGTELEGAQQPASHSQEGDGMVQGKSGETALKPRVWPDPPPKPLDF